MSIVCYQLFVLLYKNRNLVNSNHRYSLLEMSSISATSSYTDTLRAHKEEDTCNPEPATSAFNVYWLDGTLAGRVETNGNFKPKESNPRTGTVFDFSSQRVGCVDNRKFRPS